MAAKMPARDGATQECLHSASEEPETTQTSMDNGLERPDKEEMKVEPAEKDSIPAEKPAGPGPPPNGGLKAWLQVLGGCFFVMNTWYVVCFSIYNPKRRIYLSFVACRIKTHNNAVGEWQTPSAFSKHITQQLSFQTQRPQQYPGSVQSKRFSCSLSV